MGANAIGLIETSGLVAATKAIDVCLKAANVRFMSYCFTTGGLVCVIVKGGVGDVKVAVDAGMAATNEIGQVVATHVIPRPSNDTMRIIKKIEPSTIECSTTRSIKNTCTKEKIHKRILKNFVTKQTKGQGDHYTHSEDDLIAAVIELRGILLDTRVEKILTDDKPLDKYSVRVLRKVIRALDIKEIKKSLISNMRKKELINSLMCYIKRRKEKSK